MADCLRGGYLFGDAAADAPLLARITRHPGAPQALGGLFHGPAARVQLRSCRWPRRATRRGRALVTSKKPARALGAADCRGQAPLAA